MQTLTKCTYGLKGFFISVIIIIGIGLLLTKTSRIADVPYDAIAITHSNICYIIQLSIILIFLLAWPYVVQVWCKKHNLDTSTEMQLVDLRWRYSAWLVFIGILLNLT